MQRFSAHFTPENIEFMAKHAYLTTVIMQNHKKKFKKQYHITYDFITQNPYSEGLNRGILKIMRSITFSKFKNKTKRVYLIQNVDKFKKTLCLRLIQHSLSSLPSDRVWADWLWTDSGETLITRTNWLLNMSLKSTGQSWADLCHRIVQLFPRQLWTCFY